MLRKFFAPLTFACCCAALWGCAESNNPTGAGGTGGSGTSDTGGSGGSGANGGGFVEGGGGEGGTDVCVAESEKAEPIPLDIVFLLDWSSSMQGESWNETKSSLGTFFNDPVSAGISAGMVYCPTVKSFGSDCDPDLYKVLDVPIAPLPGNSFYLTNSMPANAVGGGTPLYAALQGALKAATAHQDANPTHKVIVVLTGDGGHSLCGHDIDEIAGFAKSALDYNGVRTYVIAVQSTFYELANLEKIAAEGGTNTLYNAQDIDQFSAKMAEIRAAALGCDFEIPDAPSGQSFEPDETNFSYTPDGGDTPITLPRADDLADCGEEPGWYFDNNVDPTKIIVCPASCVTIQNDTKAEVAVAFGCESVPN